MKIKTFLEEGPFLRGSFEKIVDVYCYCPADGRKVNCSQGIATDRADSLLLRELQAQFEVR